MVEQGEAVFFQTASDAHEVFFFATAVRADELFGGAPVLGEDEQADGVDVEAAGGSEAAQVARVERDAALVAFPAVFGCEKLYGGAVAFFGLAADVADGFVEEDGYAPRLGFVRFAGEVDAVGGAYFLAEHGSLAVHAYPAAFDIGVGFAPRAEAEFGHAFGKAEGFLSGHADSFLFGCRCGACVVAVQAV